MPVLSTEGERLTVDDWAGNKVLEVVHHVKTKRPELLHLAHVGAERKRNLVVAFHQEVDVTHLHSFNDFTQWLRRTL